MNRGKQYELTETMTRNSQDVDITHLDNETILWMLEESVLKSQIVNEMTQFLLKEVIDRGLIEKGQTGV